jgi:hypothetical protein
MNRAELIKKAIALKRMYEFRRKALDFTVIYEKEILDKAGKRKLENVRNDTLDMIIDIQIELEDLMNKIYK